MNYATLTPLHSAAPCKHYDVCGGCRLQHLDTDSYYAFKQNILLKTIASLGIDANTIVKPIIAVGEYARRRVEFKVAVCKGVVRLGFCGAKSHDVFDLKMCLVSDTRLITIVPDIRECLQHLKKPSAIKAIALTVLDNGIDANLTLHQPLHQADKEALINFAHTHGFIRLYTQQDSERLMQPLYRNGDATIRLGSYNVILPVGAFLQATEAGQQAITSLVTQHLQECKQVVDLYSGCGTYSFPLIQTAQYVFACEGANDIVSALHNAIMYYGLEQRMSANVRDLFKNPLHSKMLRHFDGAVINPPRNGALPQIKQMAEANIAHIVMVSCNPTTFKRDAQWLLDHGYKMVNATAIDQFYWTHHLEVVASFVRG